MLKIKEDTEDTEDTETDGSANNIAFANFAEVLIQTPVFAFLDAQSTMLFTGACKATLGTFSEVRQQCIQKSRRMLLGEIGSGDLDLFNRIRKTTTHHFRSSSLLFADVARSNEVLTKEIATKRRLLLQDPIVLLAAVVHGNEDWAREILTSNPRLILDNSSFVRDLSGKEIKGLTPLQAAICAGDEQMVQMIKEVLQQLVRTGVNLGFDPEAEIARQFAEIYPEGINAIEAAQKAIAQEFETSTLRDIFTAINSEAATPELVRFELDNPGQHTDSLLNAALHSFRAQFAKTANLEQIFNPFYLLKTCKFYDEQFDDFNGYKEEKWNRRELFRSQIIGFVQRYLPACFLQVFAQGLYDLVQNKDRHGNYLPTRCVIA